MFTKTDNEVCNAIKILDALINSNADEVLEIIEKFKNSKKIDSFTSYRLNKELKKINQRV